MNPDDSIQSKSIEIVGCEAVISDPRELLVDEGDAFTLEKKPPQWRGLPNTTEEVRAHDLYDAPIRRTSPPAPPEGMSPLIPADPTGSNKASPPTTSWAWK